MKQKLIVATALVAMIAATLLLGNALGAARAYSDANRDLVLEVKQVNQHLRDHNRLVEEQNRQLKKIADYFERKQREGR